MRTRALAAMTLAVLSLASARTEAWGLEAHRFIVARAIDLIPDSIRPFFKSHQAFIVEHSVDPDLWRTAGFLDEPPRHFLDLDAYGRYPFSGLPHDVERAVEKFGAIMVTKNGRLPWRTAEMFDRLTRAFAHQKRGGKPYALDDIQFFSAIVGHYVADAHVPFHATLNYDGQLTGQTGVHARFETELFARFRERLQLRPMAASSVTDARALVFERLLSSFQLVAPILDADRAALGSRSAYDDRYFEELRARTQPILEQRLTESITAVAALIAGAWEQTGKPDLPPAPVPPRVR